MDWADDVAYSVHDVEDGVHGGYILLETLLADADERAALCADVARHYSAEPPESLLESLGELLADDAIAPACGYDGSHRAQAALKRMTSALTGRFVAAAVDATMHGEPVRRYAADLVVPVRERNQCALLKGMALRYVMRPRAAEAWYEQQRQILADLVEVLCRHAPEHLDPVFGRWWRDAADDAARLRVVVDQVASLTDPAAVRWHHRLAAR